MAPEITIVAIAVAFLFIILNGIHDGCNVIATIIASRSLPPRKALLIACMAEFIGPLFIGTAVANTIGKGVIKFSYVNNPGDVVSAVAILSALLGGIAWNLFTWKIGIPSSSSHALIGGLLGAGITAFGLKAINWHSFFWKVIVVMFTSPVIGFIIGYFFMKISILLLRNFHPKVNKFFKNVQLISMVFLGTSHGSSDAQKGAGIVTLLLVIGGMQKEFTVPFWVMLTSTAILALGISLGGWRIIKTVGTGIYRVKPLHSFNVQLASASVIFIANLVGLPVSTTHIVSSSVMGVGSGERANAVKWFKVKDIMMSWLITIPASGLTAIICFYLLRLILLR